MNLTAKFAATAVIAALIGAGTFAWLRTEPAPQVQFTRLTGGSFSTADLRGKVVLVNFWATSCETCVHEMPKMVETYNKFAPRGYEMVAVAMSYDHPNYVAQFAQKNKLPFTVVLDSDGSISKGFGNIMVTPTTYLIDRRGNIIKQYLGEPKWDEFHALVDRALSDPV